MIAWRGAGLYACAMLATGASMNAGAENAPTQGGEPAVAAGTPAIARHAVAGGGGRSAGSGYAVHGTIGQHDADALQPASGGGYDVVGGFWHRGGDVVTDRIFADGFDD